jgi:hypothetical protein
VVFRPGSAHYVARITPGSVTAAQQRRLEFWMGNGAVVSGPLIPVNTRTLMVTEKAFSTATALVQRISERSALPGVGLIVRITGPSP